jgi:hypothetical protein
MEIAPEGVHCRFRLTLARAKVFRENSRSLIEGGNVEPEMGNAKRGLPSESSRPDFASEIGTVQEEAAETQYWIAAHRLWNQHSDDAKISTRNAQS